MVLALLVAVAASVAGEAIAQLKDSLGREYRIQNAAAARSLQLGTDQYWKEQNDKARGYGLRYLLDELAQEIPARQAVIEEQKRWLNGLDARQASSPDAAQARAWITAEQNLVVDLRADAEALKVQPARAVAARPSDLAKPELPPPPLVHAEEANRIIFQEEQHALDAKDAPARLPPKADAAPLRHERTPKRVSTPRPEPPRRHRSGVCCCDGSMSPTCTYVHSGCCSHHGGVCECD